MTAKTKAETFPADSEIKEINYKFYAILGGPWLRPSDDGCAKYHDLLDRVSKARVAIEECIGKDIAGLLVQNRGLSKPGSWYPGFALKKGERLQDRARFGLKYGGHPQPRGYCYPRKDKSGDWLREILNPLDNDGFYNYVFADSFPYSPLEIITGSKFICYIPLVTYTKFRNLQRAVVRLGYDQMRELQPGNLPEGLVEVTPKMGTDWINGRINIGTDGSIVMTPPPLE